jgi:hypothetical protein
VHKITFYYTKIGIGKAFFQFLSQIESVIIFLIRREMAKDRTYDAIVIGSGMGADGRYSSRQKGFNTLLLKRRNRGGYVVSFKRGASPSMPQVPFWVGARRVESFIIFQRDRNQEEIEFIPIHHIRNIYPGFESISVKAVFIPILRISWISSRKRREG